MGEICILVSSGTHLYTLLQMVQGPSWSWSYCSWIYNHLCNQFLSPLMLWVQILIRARCTALCDKVWVTCDRSMVFS